MTSNNNITDIFKINNGSSADMIEYNAINNVDNISDITNDDIKYSRDNMVNLIENGRTAISELLNLATQSQQSQAYDSLANLMKVVLQANKTLIDLHDQNKQMNKPVSSTKTKSETTTNNIVFNGTADQLSEILDKGNLFKKEKEY